MGKTLSALVALVLLSASPAVAQQLTLVVENGRVITGVGTVLEDAAKGHSTVRSGSKERLDSVLERVASKSWSAVRRGRALQPVGPPHFPMRAWPRQLPTHLLADW